MKSYTKEDIARLCELIVKHTQIKGEVVDNVPLNKKLYLDFGFDSIQFVAILVEIETQFNIQFDDDVFEKLYDMTVADIVDYIYINMHD